MQGAVDTGTKLCQTSELIDMGSYMLMPVADRGYYLLKATHTDTKELIQILSLLIAEQKSAARKGRLLLTMQEMKVTRQILPKDDVMLSPDRSSSRDED